MALHSRGRAFPGSEEGLMLSRRLRNMMIDSGFNTPPTYCPNSKKYPDNLMPFVDKHMDYLGAHPHMDGLMYLANLRLKTRAS